jgi:hypothetical protein
MFDQASDELLDIGAYVPEGILIAALHRIAKNATEHGRGRIGKAVLAEIYDQVKVVQVEIGNALGRETFTQGDSFFLHYHQGPARNARRGKDSGAVGLQNIAAAGSRETLSHLAAARIPNADEQYLRTPFEKDIV